MPLAEIYPLVTARALARPFTYEVPDDVGGAQSSPSGSAGGGCAASSSTSASTRRTAFRSRLRGRLSTAFRRRSSSSRSGSPTTTARRPRARSHSSRRTPGRGGASAARRALARRVRGRARAGGADGRPDALRSTRIVAALDGGGGHVLLHGPTGQRQDRGLPPGMRGGSRPRGGARSCSCRRSL